ncbi:hypothetical protein N7532_010719 [Penicillium argentinense]|uniref:F-box domain-containing protein n=1 Tax=Penicillium argentinense TaxID=1131581 RepID=A0A9W9JY69_9EURO|nr:uncharacterized protein N7532_010719 [Penicillium argentinense]KAJ5085948.1 hypothetical protein N7532_010719 [Penicillium argentinense]
MLSELPSEIIYHVAIYLPTANAVTCLAQTCRRLYKIIAADEYRLFRALVHSRFPCTPTPSFWKDAACALTSRSRALDRLGVIGRFVVLPKNVTRIGCQEVTRRDNPTLGYRPAIDSYEIWNGAAWADRKEVLAWGAAHQLAIRVKQSGAHQHENWMLFNDMEDVSSYEDICGVHLLQPEQNKDGDTEHLIFGRRRSDIIHLAISPNQASHEYKQKFKTKGLELDRTDISRGTNSTLAAHFDDGSIAFYNTATTEDEVEAFAWIRNETSTLARSRHSKLLSPSRVAVATGEIENSLTISTILPDGVCLDREIAVHSLDLQERVNRIHAGVTSIASLNEIHQHIDSPGDAFLAAWGDRTIRLHDLRSPRSYESTYRDTTDMNIMYCVHPFGNDHFLAGSSGDGLVKIFDLRMGSTYSYLDAQTPPSPNPKRDDRPSKDFSMFLSANLPPDITRHIPHPRRRGQQPYRGPIYTMSTPSPSSPTVYTGIVDGVARLDFASTDDLTGPAKEWYERNLDLGIQTGQSGVAVAEDQVFRIAGYERPAQDDFTTTSKLRTQHGYWHLMPNDRANEVVTGWDRRWEPLAKPGAWRRHY